MADTLLSKVISGRFHPTSLHRAIYPASNPSSAIRKLLIDIVLWAWNKEDHGDEQECKDYPEFVIDVRNALPDKRQTNLYEEQDTCKYHEDVAEGTPCYRTMF